MNYYDLVKDIIDSDFKVARKHLNTFANITFYSDRLIGDIRHNLAHINIENDLKVIFDSIRKLPFPYCNLVEPKK